MKIGKIFYVMVYFIFICTLTYHFCLFISLFFPGNSFSFIRLVSIFKQLVLWQKILFVILTIISFLFSSFISVISVQFESRLSIPPKKTIIRIAGIDVILSLLIFTPLLYAYNNSFLYDISENEKTRYLIIFLYVLCLLSYLFCFYADLLVKKKEQEHLELYRRMVNENEILKQQIEENQRLLEKWCMEIESYSEQLQKVEGIPKDTADYYNSILKSFQILKLKGEDQ